MRTIFHLILFSILGFQAQSQTTLEILPNPTEQYLTAQIFIDTPDTFSLIVYDRYGNTRSIYFQDKFLWSGNYTLTKDLITLEDGLYVIALRKKSKHLSKSFFLDKTQNPVYPFQSKGTISVMESDCKWKVECKSYWGLDTFKIETFDRKIFYQISFENLKADFVLDFDKNSLPIGKYLLSTSINYYFQKDFPLTILTCSQDTIKQNTFVYTNSNQFYIINPHNTFLEYKLYDLSGKLIFFASSSDSFIDLSDRLIAAKSLYIIHLSTAEGFTKSQKVIY